MPDPPISVVFLHGLEGHPNGSKVRAMRAQGLDVRAPDMKMGLLDWRRENSVARQIVGLGEVRIALLAILGGLVSMLWDPRLALLTGGALGWLFIRRRALLAAALSRSFDACIAIARAAVEDADFDVLVGSSWGGAVASELIASGVWRGPTVLLAPATARVYRRARRADGPARIDAVLSSGAPVVIFHDPTDPVVPFADSLALGAGASITLRSVDAGGHRLLGLLPDGRLVAAITDLAPIR